MRPASSCWADARPAEPARPGRMARVDYEYRRLGTANMFLVCEPLPGWRKTWVTDRRANPDWAKVIQELVDAQYPTGERLALLLDNLNTHSPGSLYEAFAPEEARRLAERLELHYTKPTCRLSTEIELSVLARQSTNRRIVGADHLGTAVTA
jgi:hypothetical protein